MKLSELKKIVDVPREHTINVDGPLGSIFAMSGTIEAMIVVWDHIDELLAVVEVAKLAVKDSDLWLGRSDHALDVLVLALVKLEKK